MRILILAALLLPSIAFSQKSETYLTITDGSNTPVKGTSTRQAYEGFIIINSLQTEALGNRPGAKASVQITFTMPVSSASSDFRRSAFQGRPMNRGEFTIIPVNTPDTYSAKIRMEDILVISCSDDVGANGMLYTTIVLSANKINWTYFAVNSAGVNAMTRRFGWDFMRNSEW